MAAGPTTSLGWQALQNPPLRVKAFLLPSCVGVKGHTQTLCIQIETQSDVLGFFSAEAGPVSLTVLKEAFAQKMKLVKVKRHSWGRVVWALGAPDPFP